MRLKEKPRFRAMTPNANPAARLSQGSNWAEAVKSCLAEMGIIRKRMKATDRPIQQADASIRRNQEETRAILRNVEAGF